MPALTDLQKTVGKAGAGTLATLLLVGALERNTRAVQSLETTVETQNKARVQQLVERQQELDTQRETREGQQAKELALAKDTAESLRKLLELREAEAARRGGR